MIAENFMNKENFTLFISLVSLILSILVFRNNKKMKQLSIQPEFVVRQIANRIKENQTIHVSLLNKGSVKLAELSAEWISDTQTKKCDIYISDYKVSRNSEVVEKGISPIIDLRNITGNKENGYIIIGYRDILGKKKKVYSPIIKVDSDNVTNEKDIKNQYLSEKLYHKLN